MAPTGCSTLNLLRAPPLVVLEFNFLRPSTRRHAAAKRIADIDKDGGVA
jgi:hypothetical protein